MSAKQALLDYIETLSEDDLESLWARIQCEDADYADLPPLTGEQVASVKRGLAQSAAGMGVPHEEMLRRFNLA